jgi:superfamily II DNA or RNA helicase
VTVPAGTGAPAPGRVHRAGGRLVVEPPSDVPAPRVRALEQELFLHADGSFGETGLLGVPVQQAHRLAEVLGRPWPAGRWPWEWSAAAETAAARAGELHRTYLRVLSDGEPTPEEVAAVESALGAGGFVRTLLPAQRGAVTALVRAEGGGNFSVPGSGKTTMTYAVYVALRALGVVDRMLVVAPQSAYEAWTAEAVDCFGPGHGPEVEVGPRSPRRSTEVVVVNYERAAQAATRAAVHGWSRGRRVLVVFDEAHRAKRGAGGEHGRGAIDLAELATRRMVLTGTPMPNGVDDLGAVLELAWPGHGPDLASPVTPGADRSWVRITKDQLDLSPAEVTVLPVTLDENHRRIYDAVVAGVAATADELGASRVLASRATARLVAAASNPALLLDAEDRELSWGDLPFGEASLEELVRDLTRSVQPAKLVTAASMAREHAERGEKLLIWTSYVGNVRELARLLAPLDPAVVTGAVPQEDPAAETDRVRELRKFRQDDGCSVLIATPQTLGEGVSLHKACQSQVHVDRTFNAGLFLQSLDRTHRVGMPSGTTARVSLLVATGTIDEAVNDSLNRKLLEMEERLRDPTLRRLTQPDTGDRTVDTDELAALLRHLR